MSKKTSDTSRTKNSIRNSVFGIISKFGALIFEFICRTVFIKVLGSEYLGLNGLFTNILTILSFAELGLGEAIIYNMYKPIAHNDDIEVSKLLKLYKKSYNIIALIIFIGGIICIPILPWLIGKTPNIKENITLIYILFLLQSMTSYFLTYRRSLISTHQKEYLCSNADLISEFIATILKLFVLLVFKNYILFLLIQISRNLIANSILYYKSKKLYPSINEKEVESLPKSKTKEIFNNVKSLVLYRFSATINSGTDNIIMAKMVNLVTVGIVSNYLTLISAANQILHKVMLSFTAGIGNLNAKDSKEKREQVFYTLNFVVTLIYGFCGIMLAVFLNPFVNIWLGKKYLVSSNVVFALALEFYICGVQYAGYNFAITTGLFKKAKWGAMASAILNIILSIILGFKFGAFGILLATGLSRLCAQTWLDPYLVFKYELQKSSKTYFLEFIRNFAFITINLFICYNIFNKLSIHSIPILILYVVLCAMLCITIFIIQFFKTWEFKDLLERIKFLIKNK